MARRQQPEVERWPEVPDDERWPVAEPDEDRWEAARNRRRMAESEDDRWDVPRTRQAVEADDERWETSSRRRTGRLRVEVPPIVNPYAIVALVAALLGLFPVAIVFGFISFTHPRGRAMALFALMIGIAEVVALAGVLVLSGVTLPRPALRSDPATVGTTIVTVTSPPPASAAAPSYAVPVPPSTAAVQPTTVAKGEVCTEPQAGLIGTAADGGTLLCLRGANGYRWNGPYTVATAVYNGGTKCNPATDKTGRTADGRALVCERNTWTLWVE
ncbi:DUF4190 domain-containing protein [Nocardia sp. CDC159]|uniref:DUF4190 domain-containing protein n=1 Tax=Nocardia pulmonis TaxID=2951408 RepID=A0A9X2J218_9NOCA|nr:MULTISPECIES: DUF4190 domain-containing protein [Nocardia]MCM6777581.1 DUF4190 domain-containing protein [Nocardia pulmonis]MCM6790312.1 DUF4190 domain-containing protein [Nocardia sp. CDC159]